MLDKNEHERTDRDRKAFNSLPRPHWYDAATRSKFLDPDPDYIAPSLFSHNLHINQHSHNALRSQGFADRIMQNYWVRKQQNYSAHLLRKIERQDIVRSTKVILL